jgi:hypothetical protein
VDSVYPRVALAGELWMTPQWSLHAELQQGILEVPNPSSGGPNKLSQNLNVYDFLVGYNFRMGPSVFGPQVEILGGYSLYTMSTDNTGASGLTSVTYSGLKFGLQGSYPITADQSWSAGAKMFFMPWANFRETPGGSGKASNTINVIGLGLGKRISNNLKGVADLDWELYSTKFSGGSASSVSQRHVTLSAGLFYLF